MKLMIMGHARHGKDTVCEILRDDYGFTFESSSMAAARYAIYPVLKDLLGYRTIDECYSDRHNHRALWFELIKAYNYRDGARLGQAIFADHDIYCGVRNEAEFMAIKEAVLFDCSVWVDASERVSAETTDSCTVTRAMADLVVDNNRDLKHLHWEVDSLMTILSDWRG